MENQVERSLFNYVLIIGSIIASISSVGYLVNGMYFDAIYGAVSLLVIIFLRVMISTQYISYDQATRLAITALLLILLLGYITSSSLEDGLIYIIILPIILPILRPLNEAKIWVALYYVLFLIINYYELATFNISMPIFIQILTIHLLLFTIVTYYIQKNIDMKENLQALNKALQKEATTDILTGAMNRRYYYSIIEKRVQQFHRDKQVFSLVLFDIDNFKNINDHYGHDGGDKVLAGLGALIQSKLRDSDIFVRFGGEEFIVYLHDCDETKAVKVMTKLLKAVEHTRFIEDHQVTISAGVTAMREDDSEESVLKRADTAMYEAKHGGKNRIEVGR